jgi:hypothetical protein
MSGSQSAFILSPDQNTNRLNAHINYGTPPAVGSLYWDCGIIGSPSGRIGPVPAPANSIGNWVHYAFVASQSADSMSIYTNGILMTNQEGMIPFVRGAYDLHIGGGPSFPYDGSLDEFRVWNVARTQAQILSDLGDTLTGGESNLVLYYRFDSSSGTVATNSATATGAAFNGTLVNGPAWVNSTIGSVLNLVVTSRSGSGGGTLRQAVSNALPVGYITFDPSLSGSKISVAGSQILLDKYLVIDASALPGGLAIDAGNSNRIFQLTTNSAVTLIGLTLTNGNPGNSDGGAILNAGTLVLNQCTVISNTTSAYAGGIYNSGDLTVNNSTFANNSSTGGSGDAGAIHNAGTLTAFQSTFTGNSANGGGAIFSEGGAAFTVRQCTVVSNTAPTAGGIAVYLDTGIKTLANSIVSGNSPSDVAGSFTINSSNSVGANPRVGPLAYNGGPTPTMALLPGSPAIHGGGSYDEVQQVAVSGGAGTFILTFNGSNTVSLAFNAAAADVQSALNALPAIDGAAAVSLSGNVYTVTFAGSLAGQALPQMTASGSGGATAVVSTLTVGMPLSAFDQRGPGYPRVLGGSVDIGALQGVYNPAGPGPLTGAAILANGSFTAGFTNLTDTSDTVLATTNLSVPLNLWSNLGQAVESPAGSGNFQFTDPQATNNPARFYRVRSP